MVFFITCLRALAACVITNAHYTDVYPTDLIANGGLIGDILFFAVSGYCLYHVKFSFPRWYGKRLYRIYPSVIIITLIYLMMGFYPITSENAISWFIYPTHYHFIASIVVLYIAYYIVMKMETFRKHLLVIMLSIGVVWLLVYLLFYDKSVYHIDNVYEPMIRFLFFESMLLGAYFRQNDEKYRNHFSWWYVIAFLITFVAYFASKMMFSKRASIAIFQPINQILIFAVLFFIFRIFAGIDHKLERLPNPLKAVIGFLSKITLEIYLVQYVIEDSLRSIAPFPLNWLVLTVTILVSAIVLHLICKGFYFICDKTFCIISKGVKKGT